METDNTGIVQTTYTYGNDLISMNRAGVNSYNLYDALRSVSALPNPSGNMVESYSYDVFCEPNTISSVGNTYMLTGRRLVVSRIFRTFFDKSFIWSLSLSLPPPWGWRFFIGLTSRC